MRARRKVTETPTGMPSRTLNEAIDLRARRTFGCWPAIVASWSCAASRMLLFCFSPTPMFKVILIRRGASIGVE